MQPYQEAAQEMERQGSQPMRALVGLGSTALTGLGAGTGLASGSAIFKKVAPFFNKYIDQGLAIKGLSKLDPRWGTFINKALSEGLSFDSIKDFVTEKAEEDQQKAAKPNSPNSEIDPAKQKPMNDSELTKDIRKMMSQGADQSEIYDYFTQNFADYVQKVEKKEGRKFYNILSDFFRSYGAQPKEQSKGQGDEKLLAALDKILKM